MVEFGVITKKGRELPQYADEMIDLVRDLTKGVMNPGAAVMYSSCLVQDHHCSAVKAEMDRRAHCV